MSVIPLLRRVNSFGTMCATRVPPVQTTVTHAKFCGKESLHCAEYKSAVKIAHPERYTTTCIRVNLTANRSAPYNSANFSSRQKFTRFFASCLNAIERTDSIPEQLYDSYSCAANATQPGLRCIREVTRLLHSCATCAIQSTYVASGKSHDCMFAFPQCNLASHRHSPGKHAISTFL